jgi:hypothetical protein
MILIEAAKLLTTTTGNTVYHLILIVTLALLLVLSQACWSRQRSYPALRWLIISGVLLSLPIVWIVLESIAMVSSVDGNPQFDFLSHSVGLLGVILLAWTCLFPEPHPIDDRFTLGATALAFLNMTVITLFMSGDRASPDDQNTVPLPPDLNEHHDQSEEKNSADQELKALVEMVGGWISIRDQSGEGTSPTVLLPLSNQSAAHSYASANTY